MKVAILTIWKSEDASSTISLHTTPQGAFRDLVCWVEDMWYTAFMGQDIGSFQHDNDRVDYFFDVRGKAYQYEIKEKEVYGPAVAEEPGEMPKLGPDEVLLNPREVKATIYALEHARYAEMSYALNEGVGACHVMAVDVANKLKS